MQAWRTVRGKAASSLSTAGYCQARGRLDVGLLRKIYEVLVGRLEASLGSQGLRQGRPVKLVDGCGYSMPDTEENRTVYA